MQSDIDHRTRGAAHAPFVPSPRTNAGKSASTANADNDFQVICSPTQHTHSLNASVAQSRELHTHNKTQPKKKKKKVTSEVGA
jgi:hypothetical protein